MQSEFIFTPASDFHASGERPLGKPTIAAEVQRDKKYETGRNVEIVDALALALPGSLIGDDQIYNVVSGSTLNLGFLIILFQFYTS